MSNKQAKLEGKAKVVKVDDIDTDQIFHASLLTIHEPEKIKPHIFGNLEDFENFGADNHKGEILIVGKNFGKGSTRQQAVTGFLAHGIQAIIGESFGPIYYSNAVNAGLLLVEAPGITDFALDDGDILQVDFEHSKIINQTKDETLACKSIPQPVIDIMEAGGLLELGKKMEQGD